jgi:tetratricopeptide (TPR) repeat protein
LTALIAMTLAAEPAFAQRGTGRMQGQITDPDGNGIEGVEITAFNPDMTPSTYDGTSGAGGRWAIIGLGRGDFKFTFRKEGYISYEIDVSVSSANRNPDLDVILNPIPEGAGMAGAGAGAEQPELFTDGMAMYDAGDYAGAITKWEEFFRLNPDLYQVQGNLGNAYRELGRIDEARIAYEALLAEEPANQMANYNLGEMLVEAGEIEGAMPYFERVLESAPDDPAVYYNVAELYFSRREMESAITYYERAIAIDPSYLPAHMQLGFAQVNAGNIPGAIAAFEKYVEIAPLDDPQLPIVKDVLAALRSG